MTLYGTAWHNYLVEQRNTLDAGDTWQFFARVPLTNSFQQVAGPPAANTAFRVTEFVADPPLLDLFSAPHNQAQMILYGAPGNTYRIESNVSVDNALTWTPGASVAMTNAFRIFPPAAASDPTRFFRARQL